MNELLKQAGYLLKLLRDCDAINDAKDAYYFDAEDVDVNAYVALLYADEVINEIDEYLEEGEGDAEV